MSNQNMEGKRAYAQMNMKRYNLIKGQEMPDSLV